MGELRRWVADTRFTEAAEADEIGPDDAETDRIRVAIIGRPNVGKSTLTNRLLGEDRQVVFDAPGTTRDAIAIPFDRDGDRFLLIDTAGVRRKGRVEGVAEKFSVVKSLKAMEEAHVVVLVMDGREGVVDQDLHLLSHAVESGSGVLVAVNKWDGLSAEHKAQVNNVLDRKLGFAPWIPVTHISALHGSGVGHLMDEVREIFDAGAFDVGTTLLTKLLNSLVTGHPPPSVRGRQIKLRFAHKAGEHPPRIAIHGNQTNALPASYVRYLENGFREALKLVGNPVMLQFRTSENPYADRRNELTPRQRKRRQRVMRHRRK
jgi:GTP-binding protein